MTSKADAPRSSRSLGRKRARDVVQFFEGALQHSTGPSAGQAFRLADWQRRDIIEPIFGTLLPDGRRQYRTVFIEVPRKTARA